MVVQIALEAARWKVFKQMMSDLRSFISNINESLSCKVGEKECSERHEGLEGQMKALEDKFWSHGHKNGNITIMKSYRNGE